MPTIDQATAGYVKIRASKKLMQERHKEELAPLNSKLELLEKFFLQQMNEMGVDSFPNKEGTPYRALQTSVTVTDWEAFTAYADEHDLNGMATHGVSKKLVREYVEENGVLPPGLKMTQVFTCNLRGPKK